MRTILLGVLSVTAMVVGLSAATAPALAATVDDIWAIAGGMDAATTIGSSKSYDFTANGALVVTDGHNVGAGVTGTQTTDSSGKTWDQTGGAWASANTALGSNFAVSDAILTKTNLEGNVTFSGNSVVTGNIGNTVAALGLIAIDGDTGKAVTVNGRVNTSALTFTKDGALTISGDADLGTVTGVANKGTLTLNGGTNTLTSINTGLKSLVLGAGADGAVKTTTMGGAIAGLEGATINNYATLAIGGNSAIGRTTLTGVNATLDVNTRALTGNVTAATNGDGVIKISGNTNVNSITGTVGTGTKAVGSIIFTGTANTQTITGNAYVAGVNINNTGTLAFSGTLEGTGTASTNVNFTADGTMSVGNNAALGTVTSTGTSATKVGTLSLNGALSGIANATGYLKTLAIAGPPRATTALGGTATGGGIGTVTVTDSISLLLLGNATIDSTVLTGTATTIDTNNQTLTGNVTATSDGDGVVSINGATSNTAIKGNVGAGAAKIGKINFDSTATKTIDGTLDADATDIRADGTLVVTGNANLGTLAVTTTNTGTLTLNGGTNTFVASVNALKAVNLGIPATPADSTTAVVGELKANTVNLGAKLDKFASLDAQSAGATISGAANFALDYDADPGVAAFGVGAIDGTGQTLDFGSITINGNQAAAGGLLTGWSGRTVGDTAINLKSNFLQYDTLNIGGNIAGFDSGTLTIGGTDVATQTIVDNMALWTFALTNGGTSSDLAATLDNSGLYNAAAAGGVDMSLFSGVVGGMMSVVEGAGAAPSELATFIGGLTTGDAPAVVQQMAGFGANNGVSGGIGAASKAAGNAITSNAGGGNLVASNGLASGVNAGDPGKRSTAWAQALGSWNNQDRRKGVDGYSADTYGAALGADTLVADTTRLGVALHYANTRVDGKGVFARNSATINTYGLSVYGQQDLTDALFLDGRLGYAYNNVNSDRYVTGLADKASGSYGAHQFDIGAKVGYKAKVAKNTTVAPHFGLGYTYLGEDGYTESGNITRLRVGSRNTNALLIGAGVRGATEFTTTDNTKIVPEVRFGASYDALASSINTTAQFVGGGASFTTRNVKPDPWTFNVGAGVGVVTTGDFTISANYDAALAENFVGHTGSIRGKLKF